MIVAGHETITSAITRGVATLLADPGRYVDLTDDPSLIPVAVEELLRLNPPIDNSLPRVATEDVDLPSGRVCAGEVLVEFGAHLLRLGRVTGRYDVRSGRLGELAAA
jgi:cytochrome P450